VTLIRLHNRLAATATTTGIQLAPHIDILEFDHPIRRWVTAMAFFAHEVLNGTIHGPYTQQRAEHFARTALIADDVFVAVDDQDDTWLAEQFNVPLAQVAEKRSDIRVRATDATDERHLS
jgi:hypothetical protein